ncbi:MAG TPA: hypothetical protein VH501_08640 [Solirubrobacterales bacterium]
MYEADHPPGDVAGDEHFNAAFAELDTRYQEDRSGPIGICVPVSDLELMRRRPEAVWPETELLYAASQVGATTLSGTGSAGTQLRVRYFYDAEIGPGLPNSPTIAQSEAVDYSLPPGYRMVPLAETDAAGPDDVLALWDREQAMPDPAEAHRRVHEVSIVGLDPNDRVAAVSTVYLQRNAQLNMDLWHLRGFVAAEHRMGNLATQILWATRDHLREAFESGGDTRAPGVLVEVENQLLMTYFNRAFWVYSDFWFIGENERGAHVRVHYFPGAQAPIPR